MTKDSPKEKIPSAPLLSYELGKHVGYLLKQQTELSKNIDNLLNHVLQLNKKIEVLSKETK